MSGKRPSSSNDAPVRPLKRTQTVSSVESLLEDIRACHTVDQVVTLYPSAKTLNLLADAWFVEKWNRSIKKKHVQVKGQFIQLLPMGRLGLLVTQDRTWVCFCDTVEESQAYKEGALAVAFGDFLLKIDSPPVSETYFDDLPSDGSFSLPKTWQQALDWMPAVEQVERIYAVMLVAWLEGRNEGESREFSSFKFLRFAPEHHLSLLFYSKDKPPALCLAEVPPTATFRADCLTKNGTLFVFHTKPTA